MQFTFIAAYFIIMLISADVSANCFSNCSALRVGKTKAEAICLAPIVLVLVCGLVFTGMSRVLSGIILFIIQTITYVSISDGKRGKAVISSLLFSAADFFLYYPALYPYIKTTQTIPEKYSVLNILICAVSLMASIPVKYFITEILNDIRRITAIYPVFFALQILAGLTIFFSTLPSPDNINRLYLVLFAVLAVINCILTAVVHFFEKKRLLESELERIESERKTEAIHYAEIENKRYELAKIRHDIRNQLNAVKIMIDSGKDSDAMSVVNGISSKLEKTSESRFSTIPLLEALISEKHKKCSDNGIKLESRIQIGEKPDEKHLNDLCSIFSNLLDNAINECIRCGIREDRIQIDAVRKGSCIVVRTTNPTSSPDMILLSENSGGYGLKILDDISKQYNGIFDIRIEDHICTAEIMVNLE